MENPDDWFDSEAPLNHRFAIYLPSCKKDGKPIEGIDAIAHSTSHMLCDRFGGVTVYPAKGLFQKEADTPHSEEILVLESFCDNDAWVRESEFLRAWARILSALLHQESVACSLDGNMSFVPPALLYGREPDINDKQALMHFVTDYFEENVALKRAGFSR